MSKINQLYDFIQRSYDDTIRDFLPRRWIVNNGVPARTARLLDKTRHRPNCKQGTVEALRHYVSPSDRVVVVGGGDGVTAVVAARRAAHVTVYEAAKNMTSVVAETAEINAMNHKITIHHSTVGPAKNVYGDDIGESVAISNLPACDVLELDCEGAEEMIIQNLTQTPRVIIIETHPQRGVSIDNLHTMLSDMEYETIDVRFQNKPHVIVGVDPQRESKKEIG